MDGLNKVGDYLLLEVQEKTIIGETWRAAALKNSMIDKYLLADTLDPLLASDQGFVNHYLNQSLISAKLEHPNILAKITALHENNRLVSIHEYQEGFTLARVLDRCQTEGFPFSIDHALLVVSKVLSALAFAKSKHITHGFVNPAMILVTHEGEIKLKGFALSASIRARTTPMPEMNGYYQKYLPPGMSLDTDRDGLDIYGCGSILFEMLTGASFHSINGDPASKIANAATETDNEQIPTQIANILLSALDPSAPSSYSDIPKMAKDIEDLLYSGEYSPTTFNLAFFMHSAFRSELEELGEKIAEEKKKNFAAATISPPPIRVSGRPTPPAATPSMSPEPAVAAVTQSQPQDKQKSKMPIILAAIVGIVAVAAVLVWVFMPKDNQKLSKFDAQTQTLLEEQKELEAQRLREQQEALTRQNELLMEQLREQSKLDNERKRKDIEDEMRQMDEEIARLKLLKEQEQRQKEIQDQLAKLEEVKKDIEEKERIRQEEETKRLAEEQAAADLLAKEQAADQGAGDGDSQANNTSNLATDGSVDDPSLPVETPAEKEVILTPPSEGEFVALDDPLLNHPVLQESYQSVLEAPRKAVRAGLVERDKYLLFLLRALVNEKGNVEEVVLHQNPLPEGQDDYGMIDKAEKVVKRLKFTSPTKMGVKVKVWMIVSVQYTAK